MLKSKFDLNDFLGVNEYHYPSIEMGSRVDNPNYIPDWDEFWMGMAIVYSSRSKDIVTSHGAVITDKFNRPLGMGYNSWIAGLPDNLIPNTRPGKYRWVRHAERNAIDNCLVDLRNYEGTKLYITGRPCIDCSNNLIAAGIRKWFMLDNGRWGKQSLIEDTHGDSKDWMWLTEVMGVDLTWVSFEQEGLNWAKSKLEGAERV